VRRADHIDVASDLVRRLVILAARWTGVSPEAVHPENVRRAALALLAKGVSGPELLAAAERGEGAMVEALRAAVSVGETYFFRYPEQFRLVARLLGERQPQPRLFRAWSAGCATGEEAYSIAALLRHQWTDGVQLEVLGTDHLATALVTARAAVYRPWSVRDSAPIAHPLFRKEGDHLVVRDELKAIVRFAVHNLFDPPPGAGFDLVFCRNVFIYYDVATVARLVERLSGALAPDGLLVLGVADPVVTPAHLRPAGAPELRVYTRGEVRPAPPKRPPPRRPARPESTPRKAAFDPVTRHIEVLHAIERGDRRAAEALLGEITRRAPDYLAARLEQALLSKRFGDRAAARAQARELLERLAGAAAGDILPGPEPLPVSHYRAAAQALLEGFQGAR
jgi:chemotaxis methyl-accepting protein methylase